MARRQAALGEQALEGLDDRVFPCRVEGFAGQDIARGLVGHRQGVTVAAVAELELPLEVGAPQIVGRGRERQRRAFGPVAPPLAGPGALDQAVAVEHRVHRALGRDPTSPASRRTSSSRILRAPQCGLSRLVATISRSTGSGSWLA
jgi:hypothetical protein